MPYKNKISGIYLITSPTLKYYIGQTVSFQERLRLYKRSKAKGQRFLHHSFLKYGFENHKIEMIFKCPPEELSFWEAYFIKMFDTYESDYGLNLTLGGEECAKSEEHKRRIGLAHKGRIFSEETRKKMSEAGRKKKLSPEHKEKISKAGFKRKQTETTKEKLRVINKGRIMSEESRKKMSEARTGPKNYTYGKTFTEEHKQKISEGIKKTFQKKKEECGEEEYQKLFRSFKGKKHSEESKQKISQKNKGRKVGIEGRKKMSIAYQKRQESRMPKNQLFLFE